MLKIELILSLSDSIHSIVPSESLFYLGDAVLVLLNRINVYVWSKIEIAMRKSIWMKCMIVNGTIRADVSRKKMIIMQIVMDAISNRER
jgi:hypothetical protein